VQVKHQHRKEPEKLPPIVGGRRRGCCVIAAHAGTTNLEGSIKQVPKPGAEMDDGASYYAQRRVKSHSQLFNLSNKQFH
jgi:hypothetical protein